MPEEFKDVPHERLKARLDEQASKAKLISHRMINTKDLTEEAKEFGKFMEGAGQVQADSSWVTSMMNAGLAPETILKVWDLKDEARRDSKNPQNPQPENPPNK